MDNPWAPPPPARYRSNGNPKSNKSKVKCKSCNAIRGNPTLRDRYYHAWFEREVGDGSETLEMIGNELGISNQAIYRHAHNHMKRKVFKVKATSRIRKEAADLKTQAMKDLELSFDHDIVVPKELHEQIIENIMVDGLAHMKVSEAKPTINQMIAAAKIYGDWKVKKRGQDAELIKMMHRSASGFTEKSRVVGLPGPQ